MCLLVLGHISQNSLDLKMLLTRIGENTKLIITGDLDQNDKHDELKDLLLSHICSGKADELKLINEYHFGGYGKVNDELIDFKTPSKLLPFGCKI